MGGSPTCYCPLPFVKLFSLKLPFKFSAFMETMKRRLRVGLVAFPKRLSSGSLVKPYVRKHWLGKETNHRKDQSVCSTYPLVGMLKHSNKNSNTIIKKDNKHHIFDFDLVSSPIFVVPALIFCNNFGQKFLNWLIQSFHRFETSNNARDKYGLQHSSNSV